MGKERKRRGASSSATVSASTTTYSFIQSNILQILLCLIFLNRRFRPCVRSEAGEGDDG